jgi:DNA-binding transcriptional LysR family regulator
LSRQVRQLETELGTRLMQRSTRKLTLTGAGVAFYEQCAPAVDNVLDAGKKIAGGTQTPSGTVRVAAR